MNRMGKLSSILALSLTVAMAATSPAFGQNVNNAALAEPSPTNQHIKSATAIGEVFGEGEKITAAVLEYDQQIDNARLSASSYSVKDRKITRVYANTSADKAAQGTNGRFVVIELDPSDPAAAILGGQGDRPAGAGGQGGPGGPGGQNGPAGPGGANRASVQGNGPMLGGGGGTRKPVKATVTQVADIATVKGGKIPGDATPIETNKAKNLIVDDFLQLNYKDPVTGTTVMYNLYVPKNYDKNKSYPMVLFMHDASVSSPDHDRTLIQGLGAVVWASPEDQAKHPSFVLAPQFNRGGGANRAATGGPNGGGPGGQNGAGGPQGGAAGPGPGGPGGQGGPGGGAESNADLVYRLVKYVVGEYNIDRNRLYTTGQSAGCMTSIQLDIKYPDLFAASLLVAGQQDPQATSVLKDKKMWIVVSEGDLLAFPGMNASIEVWEKEGAKVTKGRWSAREPASVQAANVARMIAEHNNIMYTTFIKGTTNPPGVQSAGSEHLTSMRFAYAIPGIRDWLFEQSKVPAN